MKTTVKWNEKAFLDFTRIVRALSTNNREDRAEYVRTILKSLLMHIKIHKGRPPESQTWENVMPEARTWELIDGRVWLVLVVREIGGWFSRILGRTEVEVIVRGVYNHLPSREEVGLPPW